MKLKLVSFLSLLLLIHLSPLFMACCPGLSNCDDPILLEVPVESAEVLVYSFDPRNYQTITEEQLDRRFLRVDIQLKYADSLNTYPYYTLNGSLISSAYATSITPCQEYSIEMTEHISNVEVLAYDEQSESAIPITSDFLAGNKYGGLYITIEDYLLAGDRLGIGLAYKEIPEADSQHWIVRTTLSDNRVMSDTIRFTLQ
jgi:hypothetical protein